MLVRSGNIGKADLLGPSEADGGVVTKPWLSATDAAARNGAHGRTVRTCVAKKNQLARSSVRLLEFQTATLDDWVGADCATKSGRDEAGV